MNFKTFMKKVNRGVLLGSILLVGLIVFIVVDYVSFKSEKSTIDAEFRDYFEEYSKVIATKEDELDKDGNMTKEARENKKKVLKEIVDKYWTPYSISDDESSWVKTKDKFNSNLTEIYDDKYSSCNITKFIYAIKNSKVQKYGTDGAILKVNMDYSIETKGYTGCASPISIFDKKNEFEQQFDLYNYTFSESEIFTRAKSIELRNEFQGGQEGLSVYFKKIDGKWKIQKYMDYYGSSTQVIAGKFDFSNAKKTTTDEDTLVDTEVAK